MAYRQIVALAENENAAKVVAMTASSIGAGIHAQVNAIHPSPRYTPDAQVQPYFSSEQIDQLRQQSENIAAAAKSEFARVISQGDCAWDWGEYTVESYQDFHPFRTQALTSDLILMALSKGGSMIDLLRELLLETGTPVIAAPVEMTAGVALNRIMVAWNGSMASARVLKDSMPLLVNADDVHVVIVEESSHQQSTQEEQELLNRYLQRHQVNATFEVLQEARYQTGVQLLEYSGQHDRDLLVMGGYIHSRVHRVMMGATTRQILQNTTIPVFLSH